MPIQRPTTPCDVAEQMAAAGSILTLPGVPLQRVLVGELRWLDSDALIYFPAFGSTLADASVLRFDALEIHPVGVCFLRLGQIRAFLAPIEKSAVEDPDDYRVAWSLWREVLPLRRALIDEAFAKAAASSSPPCPTAPEYELLGTPGG